MTPGKAQTGSPSVPRLKVTTQPADGTPQEWTFDSSFRIGRSSECEVSIKNEYVSRFQAEVAFVKDRWLVRDLESSNGLFVDGEKVREIAVCDSASFTLGIHGPEVHLSIAVPPAPPPPQPTRPAVVTDYVGHYFGNDDQPVGEHTMLVRRAFQQVQS